GQRCCPTRAVDEDQAVPLHARKLDQAPLADVEARLPFETGCGSQITAEAISPSVVRTDDDVLAGGGAARQEFVTAVPARIREGVQAAIIVPGEQHASGARGLRALVARVGDLVGATHAKPAVPEEMSLLPVEHG